ncbi:MAG TPA: nucleotidyltransferase domain-containing protein [Thermoanaerobaculia bacterium]|jgi:predicted nucleotidyltransferase|nr:nucleotidyltransferase domain-containing protein [Thermoanaerobaculia bacterium]
MTTVVDTLPAPVRKELDDFVAAAESVFGEDLLSVVLFGSAAEGRLRSTSDVNVLLVLRAFDSRKADAFREPARLAWAAARLAPMFLVEEEVDAALVSFADKFADVLRRRIVLHGADPFAGKRIPRDATIARLRQVLLNLTLRLREAYVTRGLREEQLAIVIADAAGPLRSAAATILELEGTSPPQPKEALLRLAATLGDYAAALESLSGAREQRVLPPGEAGPVLLALVSLARDMRRRVQRIE